MHSPTWTGCSIVQGAGRRSPGPPRSRVASGRLMSSACDRADVHADAAVDAAAVVDVDPIAHGPPPSVVLGTASIGRAASGRHPRRERPAPIRSGWDAAGRSARPGRITRPGSSPSRTARVASSVRLSAWSFSRMFWRWNLAVFSQMPRRAAISLLRSPAVTSAEDVELAVGQARALDVGADSAARAGELADDPERRRGRDRGLAPGDRLEHRPQLSRLEVLEQVAAGAGLDRLEQVVLVLGHGEHDDRDRGMVARLMRRVASSPDEPGIRTSIRTTSGSSRPPGATACSPSPAWPTTSWPHAASSEATPSRNEGVIVGEEDRASGRPRSADAAAAAPPVGTTSPPPPVGGRPTRSGRRCRRPARASPSGRSAARRRTARGSAPSNPRPSSSSSTRSRPSPTDRGAPQRVRPRRACARW